jgi:hypothetical protein
MEDALALLFAANPPRRANFQLSLRASHDTTMPENFVVQQVYDRL